MQKKISSLVICSCLALAICVSAVVSADTSGTETSGDKITFEQYLVALYKAVHTDELYGETDTAEIINWAKTNGIIEGIIDDELNNISEIPISQETALLMLSRTYSELSEVTKMITDMNDGQLPQYDMPLFYPNNIDDTIQNNEEPAEMPQPQPSQMDEKNTYNAPDMKSQVSDFTTQSANNTNITNNMTALPEQKGTSLEGRTDFNGEESRSRPQDKQPFENANIPQNNSQNGNDFPGNNEMQDRNTTLKEQPTPENMQNGEKSNASTQNNSQNQFENRGGERQQSFDFEKQGTEKSFSEHIKEYSVTYISLLLLAAAFVFIKLYRRRRY